MCFNCRNKTIVPVVVDHYTAELGLDGRTYSVTLPSFEVLRCGNCGNEMLPDEGYEKLLAELRRRLGLLAPEEIRKRRVELGLSQQELADHLQVDVDDVNRWESGSQVQERSMNRHLMAFFKLPELRDYYRRLEKEYASQNRENVPNKTEPVGSAS